jgi:hypothetical protein
MGLLDGGIAATFSAALSGLYLDATLHRWTTVDDGEGGGSTTFTSEAVKAQLDVATKAQREDPGYTDSDQRILVLASGVAAIKPGDEITVRSQRWKVASAVTDAAASHYDLRGRLAGPETTGA